MSPVIKASGSERAGEGTPFAWRELNANTEVLSQARREAAEIIAQAQADADVIRRQAAEDGREAAVRTANSAAQEELAKQVSTLLPGLRAAVAGIAHAQQAWLGHWEQTAIQLAVEIAARVIRREVHNNPQITIELVREALELASGSAEVQLRLHPNDYATLGGQAQSLANQLIRLGEVKIVADPAVEPGGCRVDTRFGTIDQQFAAQLKRIEEELI